MATLKKDAQGNIVTDTGLIAQVAKPTTKPAPINPTDIESKIRAGTATAMDFASYNQLKGSQTAGSELLQQIKPTQVTPPPTQPTAPTQQATPVATPTPTPSPTPTTPQRQGEEIKPVVAPAPKRELMPGETVSPTKIDATSTQEQIQARQEQLYNNLNSLYSANDQQLKSIIDSGDYEKYAARFNTTNPDEKKIVDAFYQANQPKTADAFYNILKSGQQIQLKSIVNNPQYNIAKQRYNDFQKYSGMSTAELAASISGGLITSGMSVYKDLLKDPATAVKMKEAEAFNKASGKGVDIVKAGENQTNEIMKNSPNAANALADGSLSYEEYTSLLSNPKIDTQANVAKDAQAKYETLKADYDNIEDAVDAEYGSISKSARAALIADRRKGMYRDLQVAQSDYEREFGYLTDLKKEQSAIVDINLELWKTQEDRKYKADLLAEERKYQEGLANREFDLKYGDIESTDPRIQSVAIKNAVADLYTKYPIKGMESAAVKEQKVRDYMSGKITGTAMSGQEAIAQVESEIRNSPGYNNLMAAQANELAAKPQTVTVDGNLYQYNTDTKKWDLAIKGTESTKPISVGKDSFIYDPTTGTFKSPTSNTGPQLSGTLSTDVINGKNITMDTTALNSFKNAISQIPGTVIGAQQYRTKEEQAELVKKGLSWTNNSKHMEGLAVDIYADNKLSKPTAEQIRVMNANGWYQPAATIAKGDYGHFEYMGTPKTTTGLDTTLGKTYNSTQMAALAEADKTTQSKLKQEILSNAGLDTNDLAKFNDGQLPPTSTQEKTLSDLLSSIERIKNRPLDKLLSANPKDYISYGKVFGGTVLPNTVAQDFVSDIDFLVGNETLKNLGKLKGPMSDKDLSFIQNSSSQISINSGVDKFKTVLNEYEKRVRAALEKKNINNKNTTQNTQSVNTLQNINPWASMGNVNPKGTDYLKLLGY